MINNSYIVGENKLHLMGWWWCALCTRPTRLVWFQ